MRSMSFLAVIWIIWKKRNSRCFEGVAVDGNILTEIIKFVLASWVLINSSFKQYSLDHIVNPGH